MGAAVVVVVPAGGGSKDDDASPTSSSSSSPTCGAGCHCWATGGKRWRMRRMGRPKKKTKRLLSLAGP